MQNPHSCCWTELSDLLSESHSSPKESGCRQARALAGRSGAHPSVSVVRRESLVSECGACLWVGVGYSKEVFLWLGWIKRSPS